MTSTRKSYISVLAAGAATLAIASSAMAADSSSVNALVGDHGSAATQPSGYSSPTALVGGGEPEEGAADYSSVTAVIGESASRQRAPLTSAASNSRSSLTSILGPGGVVSPTPVSAPVAGSSDGFDWADALVVVGISLGLALTAALLLGVTRRRTRVEPSV